jgi:hypothetical protein
MDFLNKRAQELKLQREDLLAEQRRLNRCLAPSQSRFEPAPFRRALTYLTGLLTHAQPQEQQKLLRLAVKKIEWSPEGSHSIQLFNMPALAEGKNRFDINMWSDTPEHSIYEPVIYRFQVRLNESVPTLKLPVFRI